MEHVYYDVKNDELVVTSYGPLKIFFRPNATLENGVTVCKDCRYIGVL